MSENLYSAIAFVTIIQQGSFSSCYHLRLVMLQNATLVTFFYAQRCFFLLKHNLLEVTPFASQTKNL